MPSNTGKNKRLEDNVEIPTPRHDKSDLELLLPQIEDESVRAGFLALVRSSTDSYCALNTVIQSYLTLQDQRDKDGSGVTELLNRNKFERDLILHLAYADRNGLFVNVLNMDGDKLRIFNNSYGSKVGDLVLNAFSQVIDKARRGSDSIYRLGGDEFVIIADGKCTKKGAIELAKRISRSIRDNLKECVSELLKTDKYMPAFMELDFSGYMEKFLEDVSNVQISVGISSYYTRYLPCLSYADRATVLIAQSKRFLQDAKEAGRNRVAYKGGIEEFKFE